MSEVREQYTEALSLTLDSVQALIKAQGILVDLMGGKGTFYKQYPEVDDKFKADCRSLYGQLNRGLGQLPKPIARS